MIPADWFIESGWWWLALWIAALALTVPFGAGRKEHQS